MVAKVLGLVAALVVSSSFAVAQYTGGGTGTGGTGSTTPTYTSRSYSNKGAIIGGVAAGMAGAGLLYWRLHKRATVVGCVGQNGNTLLSENNNQTYTVTTDKGVDLKPGDRVEVSGKRTGKKTDLALKVDKLRKDFGSCKQEVGQVR